MVVEKDEWQRVLCKGVDAWNKWRGTDQGSKLDLSGADLKGKVLSGFEFQNTDLRKADLTDADLTGAYFDEADLQDAVLQGAVLEYAELADCKGLTDAQLAGTRLTGASLPAKVAEFKRLEHIAELSRQSQKTYVGLLIGCLVSWLTIAATTDNVLWANSTVAPIPLIQVHVPIVAFFWSVPLS